MSERTHHPFGYATYPRRLLRALRRRDLTRDEFVILVWLYGRAKRSTWTATVNVEDIAEGIGWERTHGWLSKILRDLKQRGWLDWPPSAGSRRGYAIRLRWDRPDDLDAAATSEHSEVTPRSEPLNDQESASPEPRTTPRLGLFTPRSEEGANPHPEQVSEPEDPGTTPRSRDVRDKTRSLLEERVFEEGLDQREVLGEGRDDQHLDDIEGSSALHVNPRPFAVRDESTDDERLVALVLDGKCEEPEMPWTALERRASEHRQRLEELAAIGSGPPAGEEEILAEVEALKIQDVLIEREQA